MRPPTLLESLVGDAVIADFFGDVADIAAMLEFERALAAAQASCGLISAAAAAAIGAACDRYEPDWDQLRAGMARDGVAGPAFVAGLRARLDEPHRQWLHLQATSQDVVDTSLMLRLRGVVAELDARLAGVIGILGELRATQGALGIMGHTRMQRALPISVADKLDAWMQPLQRHRERLARLAPELLVVQFGGPVGANPRSEAVIVALADRLGLGAAPPWHTARDTIVSFGQWLALLAGSLGKIGQDVALLAQSEIGAVRLAGGGLSSSMPHKNNPVAAEVLVALARFAAAQAGGLLQAMVHENERSGAAWTLEWMTLPPLAIAVGAALRHAAAMLRGLVFVAAPDPTGA